MCWSFYRCYDPIILLPYTTIVARRLAVTSVLDREVNVRRAASAAFQEGVGRLGSFTTGGGVPDGIGIVTAADYFTVGNRVTAALDVAFTIAE